MDGIEGLEELLKQLNSIADIRTDLMRTVDEIGVFVAGDARGRVPVRNSDLKKSIQHTTRDTGEVIETVVHTNSDHAVFVEFGTGPVGAANHVGISPLVTPQYRKDKWLGVIPGKNEGDEKKVRYIAGQPAQPYLYPALKDNEEELLRYLKEEIAAAIRRKIHG